MKKLETNNFHNKEGSLSNNSKQKFSRRKFLKTAGIGAGLLGLSSLTSAWSIIQPQNQGTSNLDAQKLQGNTPNDLGGVESHDELTNVNSNDHHARPSSTNQTSSGGHWYTVASKNGDDPSIQHTFTPHEVTSEVEIYFEGYNEGYDWSYEVRDEGTGNIIESNSGSESGGTSRTFNVSYSPRGYVYVNVNHNDFYSSGVDISLDAYGWAVKEHSHSI